jgi:hypothetical protein
MAPLLAGFDPTPLTPAANPMGGAKMGGQWEGQRTLVRKIRSKKANTGRHQGPIFCTFFQGKFGGKFRGKISPKNVGKKWNFLRKKF